MFVVNGDYAGKKKSFSIENFDGNTRVLNQLLMTTNDTMRKVEKFPSSLGNEDTEERINCEDDWRSREPNLCYSQRRLKK